MNDKLQKHSGDSIATAGFGTQSLEVRKETAATALAAAAKAEIEARYIVAMERPRNWLQVRTELLAVCQTPGFASEAYYDLSFGNFKAEGLSVRFAEAALRSMGNLDAKSSVLFEDNEKRIINVVVNDLEKNISIPTQIVIEKTVEKSFLKQGTEALGVRINSEEKPVYTVKATEQDVFKKQNSAISKAIRNGVLRLLPAEIQAECKREIKAIRNGAIAKDPEGAKIAMVEAFASIGVKPKDIENYLLHSLDTISPAEIQTLRDLYTAIKDGHTSWQAATTQEEEPEPKAEVVEKGSDMDKIANSLKGDKKK